MPWFKKIKHKKPCIAMARGMQTILHTKFDFNYAKNMEVKTKNFRAGKAPAGFLFVTGIFFLTLAFTVLYFSHFGLEPLPQSAGGDGMAAAALGLSQQEPVSQEVMEETHNKEFLASLSQTPVKEIFIGSYGFVDKEILEGVRGDVEKSFGVKTTILNPGPVVPEAEPFYDKNRRQYNSDVLLKSVVQSSLLYGPEVRFLYVLDAEMDSFSGETPSDATWLRAENGENAALISIHSFRENFSTNALVLERAQKAAMRALGITVGFDTLLSATDSTCVMYPVSSVGELDAGGSEWCLLEQEGVVQVFQK